VRILLAAAPALLVFSWAMAADGAERATSPIAIASFLAIVALTLGITYWAARRTRTAHEFYAAGSSISGWQNGLAIAGDFMSAATFLGTTALFFTAGFDAIIFILCPPIAYTIFVCLMAERLRNLGRFTFADVICSRLDAVPMRIYSAAAGLVSAIMYLIAQMVGAGGLIQVLFDVPYNHAVILVGILMVLYVAFGGMLATTWVQITKAVLLMSGVAYMAIAVLHQFGYDFSELYRQGMAMHDSPQLLIAPGGLNLGFISALSLAVGLSCGILGSPHILMRFFTVPDARAARQSAFVALLAVSFVFVLIHYVIAVGALALVKDNPAFLDETGAIVGGTNMVTIHLAQVVGGEVFLGIISAIAFATILAVVAGLTLASASAVSHDLYANVFRRGKGDDDSEVIVSRIATLAVGVAAIILGIAFHGQNIAYLVALALAVAASANFPVLFLSMYWSGLTTRGAWIGGGIGLLSAILFVFFGPAVWVQIFGFDEPIFPSAYPALYSMTLAFLTCWLVSKLDRSPGRAADRERFMNVQVQTQLGRVTKAG
jgi:cation/acetate symporter